MASTYELMLLALSAQLAVPVNATPTSTSASGSVAGGTETIDSVLGNYSCTLVSGRRYMVVMNGLVGNCGTAGDIYLLNIRNSGSASTPTASSQLVAQSQWTSQQSGTSSRMTIPLSGSFIASSTGTSTFAFFAQRISGSGSFTPLSTTSTSPGSGFRELYVMYLGVV